jgi:gliding motility-associated-like protein
MKSLKKTYNKLGTVLGLAFLTNFSLNAQTTETFSTPGTTTWTVPACVNSITVQVWAGGGGGGAVWSRFDPKTNSPGSNEICPAAGGGGGGGFVSRTYTVVPGQTYNITVGAGGIGGVINNSLSSNRAQNGSAGGNSIFSGPATAGPGTLTAFGGSGGFAANIQRSCLGGCSGATHQGANGNGGSGNGGSNGTTTFFGGNGSAGVHSGSTEDRSGAGGGGAGSTANGGNASGTSAGSGGNLLGGNGANGNIQPYGNGYLGTNGQNGNSIGGGGGGASGHNRGQNNNTHRTNIGGNGARGEVRIIYSTSAPSTPTISSTAPTCSAAGSSTISNYNASLTYNFTPAGPTVGAGGVISGMVSGINYTVTANNGSCNSSATSAFNNAPALPTISSTAPTCSAAGSSTISNYNASLTYNFTPSGPTVGAGGVISGMVTGTNYTVTANNGSCNSSATAAFNNADMLPSPIVTASSTAVCENGFITLTPTTGGTWVSNNTGVATVTAGGVVTIVNNGSVDFTFTATNTCTATTPAVLVNPEDTSSFSYTSNSHCLTGIDPVATVTGTPGGTFTITSPGVINATTGEIDLSASGIGSFTVYYNTASAGNPCPSIDSVIINITSAPSADFSYNVAQSCQDATAPILSFGVGSSAGVFSSTPAGLSLNTSNGAITLSTSTPGVYTVYNTIAASGGCASAIDSATIEVLQLDDATFNFATGGTYCLTGTDPIATLTGTAGGTFTITVPGVINATTGEIDLNASGTGTFTVYYNTPSGNACPQIDSTIITITDAPTAGFSYNIAQTCQDATNPILTMNPGATVGVFSSTPAGLTLNINNGDITLSTSTPGIYTVYNTVAAAGGCAQAIDSTTIEVLPLDDATFNYITGGTYCLTGTDPIATVTGTTGGTFTISSPGVINSTTGEIDLDASGLGSYTVYYNTPSGNACPQIDSTTISILDAPGASFTYATPFCQDNGTALPTFSGNNFAGTFSEASGGVVFVNTTTGELDLATSTPGTYTIYNNLAASGGCAAAIDSFVITINPSFNLQETVSVCSGGSYTFPDGTTQTNITLPTTYNSNLTSISGCDSIIETTVNVNPTYFIQETTSICSGGSYTFPDGTTQTNITLPTTYNSNLTSTSGCDSIIETTVNVDPQLSITADPVAPICFGENIILTATGSGNGTVTWYSDAAGTNVIGTGSPFDATSQVSTTGSYTFYINEAGTCSSALTAVNVLVGGVTAAITAIPTSGFMPLDVSFTGTSTGNTFEWNFGDGTTGSSLEETHIYSELGTYTAILTVSDNGNCPITIPFVIEVIGESSILIPNVFTPNGDGSNDVFTVVGTNLTDVNCVIFNRWGQKLYEWDRVKGYWDGRTLAGKEVPDGTYFFIVKAKGIDGKEYFEKGGFSLIR